MPHWLGAVVLLLLGTGVQARAEEPGADKAGDGAAAVEALIRDLKATDDASQREVVLFRLRSAGTHGVEPTRAARDATPRGKLWDSLHEAYLWQLSARAVGVLQVGIDSQLTFDGQFAGLGDEGKDIVDALLRLIDDEVAPIVIRIHATRALADVVEDKDKATKRRLLPHLRELNGDVLVAPVLREQIEILLAILGERNRLFRDIRRLEKMADSKNIGVILRTNEALATLNYRIRNYEKAVSHYDRILVVMEDIHKRQKDLGVPDEALAELQLQMALHYYNAACSNSLHGDISKAQAFLKKAVGLHAEHFDNIERDGDLRGLCEDSGYAEFRRELEAMFEGRSL